MPATRPAKHSLTCARAATSFATSSRSRPKPTRPHGEPEWNSFEAEVKKYVESFSKQVEQQKSTFKLQSAAQLKAWREAADKLGNDTKQFATDRQAEIDAAATPSQRSKSYRSIWTKWVRSRGPR
jgi:hypothetical protein